MAGCCTSGGSGGGVFGCGCGVVFGCVSVHDGAAAGPAGDVLTDAAIDEASVLAQKSAALQIGVIDEASVLAQESAALQIGVSGAVVRSMAASALGGNLGGNLGASSTIGAASDASTAT